MSNVKFLLNGTLIDPAHIDGALESSIVIRAKDESGESGLSYTQTLTFYGDAYDIIKSEIIDAPDPNFASVDVLIFDTCCRAENGQDDLLLFSGRIEGAAVRWCEFSCFAEVVIVDNSGTSDAQKCVRNTIIWNNTDEKADGSGLAEGENAGRGRVSFAYCLDIRPYLLGEFILILGMILKTVLYPVIVIIATIVTVINAILWFINLFGANIPLIGDNNNVSFFDEVNESVFIQVDELVVGCRRKRLGVFLESYLVNVCEICGLNLESSILGVGGALENLTRVDIAVKKGGFGGDGGAYQEGNRPNLTGLQFLQSLRELRLDFRIEPDRMLVEHESFFFGDTLVDVTTLDPAEVLSLCWEVSDEPTPPAFGIYEYTEDGQDKSSNDTRREWGTVVDWNDPPSNTQRGELEVLLPYSSALFRQDTFRDDVSPLDKNFYANFYDSIKTSTDYLLLSNHRSTLPKLLFYNPTSPKNEATVPRIFKSGSQGEYYYNYPAYLSPSLLINGTHQNNFYDNLYFIDDPRDVTVRGRRFDLEIIYSCEILRKIKPTLKIVLPFGQEIVEGKIEQININTKNRTLLITGRI